jgi:hypothetical protein
VSQGISCPLLVIPTDIGYKITKFADLLPGVLVSLQARFKLVSNGAVVVSITAHDSIPVLESGEFDFIT